MKTFGNSLIILAIATSAWAQVWPSAAISDPETGLPGSPPGQLSIQASSASLKSDFWTDQRSKFSISLGLGSNLGLFVGSSFRRLEGYNAFQNGIGDTRMGLSYWPAVTDRLTVGINGYFIVPTGFRTQESYYNPTTDSLYQMPAFSMKQTGGEVAAGMSWSLGPVAELNGFAGYFSTSDQVDQAFRWGMGAWLAPLGPRYAAELGYSQSQTRAGLYPNTEAFTAALALKVAWGFSLVPGMVADLADDPLYGGSLGLRFTAPIPAAAVFGQNQRASDAAPFMKFNGNVLVPPPLSSVPVADRDELWKSIRDELRGSFDEVIALPSLDVPGLPYNDATRPQQDNSIRAIAKAHPDADWLLIARVEREDVMRDGGVSVPLIISQTQWTAECLLKVELISLRQMDSRNRQTVEGRAVRKEAPSLAVVSKQESEVLSLSASRELTFQAYREAGREIARELQVCEPDFRSSSR